MMINNKTILSTTTIALLLITVVIAGPLAYATAINLNSSKSNIVETQKVATQDLTADEKQINGVVFTPRFSTPVQVEAGQPNILFADCLPNEFAVSGSHMFQTSELEDTQSFPIAWSDNRMSWLTVVENTGTETLVASNGVVCASEGDESSGVSFDSEAQTTINNIIKQSIKIEGGQITNINQITNIYQSIVQNITQIINISNSTITNSTINQIANQSASQIIGSNGTNIEQAINQTATQVLETETAPEEVVPPTTNTTASEEEEDETPTLPIDETSAQPVQPPTEEETTEEPTTTTTTPPVTTGEEETTTETPEEETTETETETSEEQEEETTTTEEPTSQLNSDEEEEQVEQGPG